MTPSEKTVFLLLLGALWACDRQETQTYRIPKKGAPPAMSARPKPMSWKTPAGWIEQTPSEMRVGSFLISRAGEKHAEMTIIPLSGEAGGDLANINRWRGQINLPPIAETDLPQHSVWISPAGRKMRYVDFAHDGQRVVAAIYPQNARSWFFKLMGDAEVVAEAVPAFKSFLETIRVHER